MSGKLFDRFVSAFVGAASAVGTVWFLSARDETDRNTAEDGGTATKIEYLEVGALKIDGSLVVVDPTTGEPTIELRGDSVFVQKGVYAERVGAYRVVGQKIQTTPGDPLAENGAVFGELATNEDGGAYVALLSPRESHSVTIGFDKNEKGCVLSQNNDDSSVVAQAIFLKPTVQDAVANEENAPSAPAAEPSVAAPLNENKSVESIENVVPTVALSAENSRRS